MLFFFFHSFFVSFGSFVFSCETPEHDYTLPDWLIQLEVVPRPHTANKNIQGKREGNERKEDGKKAGIELLDVDWLHSRETLL